MVDPFYPPTAVQPTTVATTTSVGVAARRDIWWTVAALGIVLLLLAQVILFFDARNHSAAGVFGLIGYVVLEVGLVCAAWLGNPPWGARVALMLGAAFLAVRTFPASPF